MNKIASKTIDILEYAAEKHGSFRIVDVVKDLDIPKATAFNLIYTLVEKEMLEIKNASSKTFTLGAKAYSIGIQYMNKNDVIKIVENDMRKLGDTLSKTVFMGTLDNNEVLYLYKYSPSTAILDPCSVNTRAGVYYTALGKSLVAFQNSFDFDSINFKRLTKNTITTIEDFQKELAIVRERGYSVDNQEIRDSMVCIAAPIYNADGIVKYAISASSLLETSLNIAKEAEQIIATAKKISKKLGYNE